MDPLENLVRQFFEAIINVTIIIAEYLPYIIALLVFYIYGKYRSRLYRERREANRIERRDTYREYLKTDDWKRKRYVVLKRDNWTCQHCGVPATQVHHLKYAKYNIGKEPIEWLVSLCKPCHEKQH